jgi:hypothetical protein
VVRAATQCYHLYLIDMSRHRKLAQTPMQKPPMNCTMPCPVVGPVAAYPAKTMNTPPNNSRFTMLNAMKPLSMGKRPSQMIYFNFFDLPAPSPIADQLPDNKYEHDRYRDRQEPIPSDVGIDYPITTWIRAHTRVISDDCFGIVPSKGPRRTRARFRRQRANRSSVPRRRSRRTMMPGRTSRSLPTIDPEYLGADVSYQPLLLGGFMSRIARSVKPSAKEQRSQIGTL